MKVALLLCIALTCVCAAKLKWYELDSSYTFESFLQHYGKQYTDESEYKMRKSIFEANLQHVISHNKDTTKTWKEEINHLADWTDAEYKQLRGYDKKVGHFNKAQQTLEASSNKIKTHAMHAVKDLPVTVDWRQQGVVTAVKDQGHCGSCWSFAAAETLESHWAISNGDLWDLSEQQILDCTSNPLNCGGNGGCEGGTAEVAYASIVKMGGLSSEWTYSYQSYQGLNYQCRVGPANVSAAARASSYVALPSNQYTPLMTAVATLGPIAISVDANAWRFYGKGVFNGCNQTNPDIDHAVQLVGYGNEGGQDYWLVRNSWGPAWGEAGYIKLFRSSTVQCGTDLSPSDGSGCDNGPATVTVCGTCGILYDTCYPVVTH